MADASFSTQLILPGRQRESFRSQMESWLQEETELYAPTLWTYEMTSVLSKAAFFGLVTAEEAEHALPLLWELVVHLIPPDAEQIRRAFKWTRRLNRAAAYDSFYLALAEFLHGELWTADRRLHAAVGLPWVRLAWGQ